MAKERKYRTKADAKWAREDDKRQAENARDLEDRRKKQREEAENAPAFSVCPADPPHGFFWVVWPMSKVEGEYQYGFKSKRAAAVESALKAIGSNPKQWDDSVAAKIYLRVRAQEAKKKKP